jgi:hypothetical protein
VHLLQVELFVGEERLRGLAQHQLQLTQRSPPGMILFYKPLGLEHHEVQVQGL